MLLPPPWGWRSHFTQPATHSCSNGGVFSRMLGGQGFYLFFLPSLLFYFATSFFCFLPFVKDGCGQKKAFKPKQLKGKYPWLWPRDWLTRSGTVCRVGEHNLLQHCTFRSDCACLCRRFLQCSLLKFVFIVVLTSTPTVCSQVNECRTGSGGRAELHQYEVHSTTCDSLQAPGRSANRSYIMFPRSSCCTASSPLHSTISQPRSSTGS